MESVTSTHSIEDLEHPKLSEAKEICDALEVLVAATPLPRDSRHLQVLRNLHNRMEALIIQSRSGAARASFPCLLAAAMLFASFFSAKAAYADTYSRTCYRSLYDRDGDGFAAKGAPETRLTSDQEFEGLSCPNGYVRKAGDCNDTRASVRPQTAEIGFNNIDDNCNGKTDEPVFAYSAFGHNNTSDGFQMHVRINDWAHVLRANDLYAKMRVTRLRDGLRTEPSPTRVRVFNDLSVVLTVTNLSPITVYQTWVEFGYLDDAGAFQRIGDRSANYYTVTLGTSEKTLIRAHMVLKGLKEFGDSQDGEVGYRGEEPDGTRYGADRNEKWCTEFYVWVARDYLRDLGGINEVEELVDYFRDHNTYYSADEIITRAAPGDYIPQDTNDDGKKNHSSMFLAYDEDTGTVWTLEGNNGNKVWIEMRSLNSGDLRGLGYIINSILR